VRTMGIPVKKFIVLHFGANVVNVFFFKNIWRLHKDKIESQNLFCRVMQSWYF
jgi:hypothetical protein